MFDVICDDVLDWAAEYAGEKFHACLCDPPYELAFMGKSWDQSGIPFQSATWAAIAEHLHPGGFIMAFGGSRTYHRLACAVEDAGLVVHPAIVHLQSQGFPKATRIDTQIDKAAGAEREVVGKRKGTGKQNPEWNGTAEGRKENSLKPEFDETTPATPLAATWAGHRYGLQALKPCAEFILCAQKPYSGRPVDSIVETGAGSLNIEDARVATGDVVSRANNVTIGGNGIYGGGKPAVTGAEPGQGRWPPNVTLSHIPPHPCPACDGDGCEACGDGWLEGCRRVGTKRVHASKDTITHTTLGIMNDDSWEPKPTLVKGYTDSDGKETIDDWQCVEGCPVRELGEMSGERKSGGRKKGETWVRHGDIIYDGDTAPNSFVKRDYISDTGTAARFYPNHDWQYEIAERLAGVTPFRYQAKAGRKERDAGLEGLKSTNGVIQNTSGRRFNPICNNTGKRIQACDCGNCMWDESTNPKVRNPHPTVKPIALALWLCNLLTPPPEYAPRRLLIPFAGSGSEMCAAILSQGFEEIIGIEMEEEYVRIAEARCHFWEAMMKETGSSDPGAILKTYGKKGRVIQDLPESSPDENHAQMSLGV